MNTCIKEARNSNYGTKEIDKVNKINVNSIMVYKCNIELPFSMRNAMPIAPPISIVIMDIVNYRSTTNDAISHARLSLDYLSRSTPYRDTDHKNCYHALDQGELRDTTLM